MANAGRKVNESSKLERKDVLNRKIAKKTDDKKKIERIEDKKAAVEKKEDKEESKDEKKTPDNRDWKRFGAFIQSMGVEVKTEDEHKENAERALLRRALDDIVQATPTQDLPSNIGTLEDPTKYSPSGKYGGTKYAEFKYSDSAKYTPAVDEKLMDVIKNPGIEYKRLSDMSPMLEKTPESKKFEESKEYKPKKVQS